MVEGRIETRVQVKGAETGLTVQGIGGEYDVPG